MPPNTTGRGEFHAFILPRRKKQNYFAMAVPKEYGGLGYDALDSRHRAGTVGLRLRRLRHHLAASVLSMDSVLVAGTEAQKKLFFTPMVNGEDRRVRADRTRRRIGCRRGTALAKKEGEEYILNGTKCFISNGGYAKVYVVFASRSRPRVSKGLTAFIVEREREGWWSAHRTQAGHPQLEHGRAAAQERTRPGRPLLGKEGDGMKIAMKTLDMARPAIAALSVGVAQRALDECVQYLRTEVTRTPRYSQARQCSSSWPIWRSRSRRRGNCCITH